MWTLCLLGKIHATYILSKCLTNKGWRDIWYGTLKIRNHNFLAEIWRRK